MTRILAALLTFLLAWPALAQETPEEERSFFIGFVESQLSGPNRQIRISGIQGVLSSSATIGEITVADNEGVWMRIVNAGIEWQRSALLLGRLQIGMLRADLIEVSRRPLPDESLPTPEARPFQLPELPLSINLDNLEIARATFGQDVFGLASELSATGNLRLAGGSLQTALNMERLDGPGGTLQLTATYANETEVLDLDLALSEPENGIVANLLNIEGRPPVELALSGEGPLADLDLSLTLDAAGERILTGATRLDRTDAGLAFAAEVEGPIARLIAPAYRPFFGERTRLSTNGVVRDEGGVAIEALDLDSAALSLTASAETSADGFLRMLRLDAGIADRGGAAVVLPVPGASTTVDSARLRVDFGGGAGEEWSGALEMAGLATDTVSFANVDLRLGGLLQNVDRPSERRITFDIGGNARGIASPRPEIAEALGDAIELAIAGAWQAGEPVSVDTARLSGTTFALTAEGEIADYAYQGDIRLDAESLAPFSQIAGRDLGGTIALGATGTLRPLAGGFDLTLDASANELRVDIEAADRLMSGTTTITGRVARGEDGLTTDGLRVANGQFELTANGTFATGAADFGFDLALADLALVAANAQGRVTATGRATGSEGLINLTLTALAPSGRLADRTLSNAALSFEGTLRDQDLEGLVAGDAFLDGVRVDLSSRVALAGGERRLTDLRFNAGGAALTGELVQAETGLVTGGLVLAAPDVSTAAALFLREAQGAVDARIDLAPADGRQGAALNANVAGLVVDDIRVGRATAEVRVEDLFGVPAIDGAIEAADVTAGGVAIATLNLRADQTGATTDFSGDARLENGATLAARGALSPEAGGFRVVLAEADLAWQSLAARLTEPASLLVVGDTVTLDALVLDVGGGGVLASGRVAETIDVDVAVTDLPLAIANAIRPDLALAGTLAGTARVTGPRARPDIRFEVRGREVAAAPLAEVGLGPLSIDANGNTAGDVLSVDARVRSTNGFDASTRGTIGLGSGALGLDVSLASFPLAALDRLAPGQNPGGNLTGSARVTGTLDDPRATFDLAATNVTATPLVQLGAAPVNLSTSGRFAANTVTLDTAQATGPQGLSLTASGAIPLVGAGLNVAASASVPLPLANRLLVDRGTQLSGVLVADLRVTGSLAQPNAQGDLTLAGAAVVDPLTNVRLGDIALSAGISGETVTIRSVSASVSGGGTISGSGTVAIDPAGGFPANLNITLNEARYTDGALVVATVSGGLSVTGALARDPLISGALTIGRAEITISGGFGGGAAAIDVIHVNPPPDVAATLRRARASDGTPVPSARPSVARLDVTVSASNRIFVRGRGLDAELGGQVRLTGPVTGIQPVGAFNLIRGRLGILGQRITFDEGTVTLIGDLDPFIDFVARSQGSDIVVFITVRGRVSDPAITFSAQPELPQDEVLARLIFNRGLNELSAFQIAQLAAAAAELAGGSNTSLLQGLRGAAGLDDLDIVTDSQGNAAVRAGRYIQDNVYLGVEAGASGTTRGTINLDITNDLKARGAVGTDGETSLGIFFERDY